jgi:SagB-type dehydrogenase family enzyme
LNQLERMDYLCEEDPAHPAAQAALRSSQQVVPRVAVRRLAERPVVVSAFGIEAGPSCELPRSLHVRLADRVARVTGLREEEVSTPRGAVRQQFAPRPYPAGGGLYELELYAVVQACHSLSAGLYHYDAAAHRLIRLRGCTPEVAALLGDAAESTGTPAGTLQVLLILAARFPRVAWKCESIAYALTLKHVGVLYQTMYLTATAMGLAPCAIGGGDVDLFARAAGTDYYAETSVGEFLLGNPRPPSVGRIG